MLLLFALFVIHLIVFIFGNLVAIRLNQKHHHMTLEKAHRYLPYFTPVSVVMLLLLVTLFVSLKIDRLAQIYPLILQRYMVISIWFILSCFLAYLGGYSLTIAFKENRNIFSACIIVLNGIFLYLYMSCNAPIYDKIKQSNIENYYVAQTTLYSCAPASFAMIARSYGFKISEREASKQMRTTSYGTTAGEIRYALYQLGFKYEMLDQKYSDLSLLHSKAILFVDRRGGYENHSVAYVGQEGGKYKVLDPMEGIRLLSKEEVDCIWHGNGLKVYR